MKKLFAILLTLALLLPCAAALAEDAPLKLGYIAPIDAEGGRYSLCADAFAYAAAQKGISVTTLRYDPSDGNVPADADGENRPEPAVAALMSLIEDGVNGVALAATSLDQAQLVIDLAEESGVAIVVEGLDISSAYPAERYEVRPYVASIGYGDAPAYIAAKWLENAADNPVLFHCALPVSDPAIQSGLKRALRDGRYLELAEDEVDARANTAAAGSEAVNMMISSFTIFGCVLADSEALAQGCAEALRRSGESMPVAAIASSPEALDLLKRGSINMLAAAPASVEGVETFKVLHNYLTDGILPETAFIQLPAITATAKDSSSWISDNDFETAYALSYPEADE